MTLPMDMKKLGGRWCQRLSPVESSVSKGFPNPKVAPEPSMYWPNVLMMPLGPAPYLKMLTVPGELRTSGHGCKSIEALGDGHTEDEADDAADSYNRKRLATGMHNIKEGETYCRPSWHPS